jgi:hypothetical protein
MFSTTAYETVRAAAEQIKNDEHAVIEAIEPGDVIRQGDIYLVALAKPLEGKPYGSRQLAPGTTQGSRHIVDGKCRVIEPDRTTATKALNHLIPTTTGVEQFLGPVILADEPITITHPEHGDRTLPKGSYLVVYQRAFADTLRRTMD